MGTFIEKACTVKSATFKSSCVPSSVRNWNLNQVCCLFPPSSPYKTGESYVTYIFYRLQMYKECTAGLAPGSSHDSVTIQQWRHLHTSVSVRFSTACGKVLPRPVYACLSFEGSGSMKKSSAHSPLLDIKQNKLA